MITPVDPSRSEFLDDAWRSVVTQRLPPGCEMEWVVQVDGSALDGELPDDPRIRIAETGSTGGASVARNLALFRATGEWIVPLDADDLLADGALSAAIGAVRRWPETRWVAGPCLDRVADGTLEGRDLWPDLATGPLPAGWFVDYVERTGTAPWRGTAGVLHADTLRAVGGWPALPRAEDLAPWFVISDPVRAWPSDEELRVAKACGTGGAQLQRNQA